MTRFILICLIYCFNISALASETDVSAAQQLELYIREIKSIAIDFKQTDSQGTVATGKLLIDKPLKFRCNYYAPFPLLIIGNKNYLSIYDYDMDQLSNIEIEKYFDIKNIITQKDTIKFVLYHHDSGKISAVSFDTTSKQITQMEIIEGDSTTEIAFSAVHKASNFDPDLFILKNPDVYGAPARLSKQEIEKKYTSF